MNLDFDEAGLADAPEPAPAAPSAPHPAHAHARLLLVADGDPTALRVELAALAQAELLCLCAEPEAATMRRAARWAPDLALVLGGALPLHRRVECLSALRADSDALVVLVLDGDPQLAPQEEQLALDLGFDAVWRQLGTPDLLCTRVRALLRARERRQVRREVALPVGPLLLQNDPPLARCDDRVLDLTYSQVQMLQALAQAPARALTRAALAAIGRGGDEPQGPRTVDTRISRLRQRLRRLGVAGVDVIALRDVGYRLVVAGE